MNRTRRTYLMLTRDHDESSSNSSDAIITPNISNLSIGPIPTDSTNIVRATVNELGLADKLNALVDEYRTELVVVPNTGRCASSVTARVPRAFIAALHDALNVNNNSCLQETQTFLQMLVGLLSSTIDDYISITRNFWKQMGRVFSELNINESRVNAYAAVMRAMAASISSDVQSLPTNEMLVTSIDSNELLISNSIEVIDSAFSHDFENALMPQPDLSEVVSTVLTELPTTIGVSSTMPPTNIVGIDASSNADNVQIYDLDDSNTLESESYNGMKNLFSSELLTTPINKLKIFLGPNTNVVVEKDIKYVENTGTDAAPVYTSREIKVLSVETIDLTPIDMNKSILEQDWALADAGTRTNSNWIPIQELNSHDLARGISSFIGLNSRRTYSMVEARSLSDSLSKMWSKVVNMKLPSAEHVQMGTNILAMGLGAVGQLTGSAGLVTASNVVGTIGQGLGSLVTTLELPSRQAISPKASIAKNALSVVPALIDAGKGIMESVTVNAQDQRIKLSSLKNEIENSYITGSSSDLGNTRVARLRARIL